jgi:hypothetical protein
VAARTSDSLWIEVFLNPGQLLGSVAALLRCAVVARSAEDQVVGGDAQPHVERRAVRGFSTLAEGYPVKPAKDGKPLPAAFAWTGTRSLFAGAGFEVVGNPEGGKARVRRFL